MKLHLLTTIIGILFAIACLIGSATTMDWDAVTEAPDILIFSIVLMFLPMVPIAFPVGFGWLFRKSKPAVITCLVALIAAFGFMVFVYFSAFHVNPDPQSGLVFVFGPIVTTLGLIPFGITALVFFLKGGN